MRLGEEERESIAYEAKGLGLGWMGTIESVEVQIVDTLLA